MRAEQVVIVRDRLPASESRGKHPVHDAALQKALYVGNTGYAYNVTSKDLVPFERGPNGRRGLTAEHRR